MEQINKHQKIFGLTQAQIEESRVKYGTNTLTPPQKKAWWKEYLCRFSGPFGGGDPLIFILEIAGLLSIGISLYEYYGLGQSARVFFEPVGIFIAILLATTLATYFEQQADKEFQILNQTNDDELVQVIRDGSTTRIPKRDVVVGDIVILNTGDEIPADGELMDAVTLSVDESTLTGEPICHKTTIRSEFDKDATYPSNQVMRGTKVMEGHGMMRVSRVGDATEMGKVYEEAQIDDTVKTPLNEQLDGLSMLITNASYGIAAAIIAAQMILFMGWDHPIDYTIIIPIVLFLWIVIRKFKGWSMAKCTISTAIFLVVFFGWVGVTYSMISPEGMGEDLPLLAAQTLKTLMVAVTLIVVAVPEGLPMAVTLSLAYSMRRMLKTNNLVRKMHACETMGAATVICTDKTGTLTQNRMQVREADIYANRDSIYEGIAVNTTATLDRDGKPLGNPTEGALLLWLKSQGVNFDTIKSDEKRIAEIPFTTERKYMATAVSSSVTGKPTLYVKGAPEIVLAMCGTTIAETDRKDIEEHLLGYQSRGMRTLGLAYQTYDSTSQLESVVGVLRQGVPAQSLGMNLQCVFAIEDPVRADVPEAVSECIQAGISIKIVTGDTPATAKEIGRQIGLWTAQDTDRNIISGPELAQMTDTELTQRASDFKIISRARPTDKRRLVEALQSCGQVVAVTGDGTNDAPALHQAHVGLSMGDGTSVAKEASDITIIDNSFASIGRAVMWGRSLYKNIQRFLLFQLTVNVAACLLVLCGSFIGNESPLTVTQMLWVNLIMDTFGAMALSSLPPNEHVMRDCPRNRRASILSRPMMSEIVGVGSLFFLITIVLYWIFNHADVTSIPSLFDVHIGTKRNMTPYEATLLFSVFVWTHFWYMFNARTFETDESVFRTKMSQGFWTIVAIIVFGQLFITELAYEFFNVEPMLHTTDWKFNPSGALDLLIIVAASSLVLWVREIWHLIKH